MFKTLTPLQELALGWARSDCNFLALLNGSGAGNTTATEAIGYHCEEKHITVLDGIVAIKSYLASERVFHSQINYVVICRPQEFITFADKIKGKYTVISGFGISDNPYLDNNYKNCLLDMVSKKNWS